MKILGILLGFGFLCSCSNHYYNRGYYDGGDGWYDGGYYYNRGERQHHWRGGGHGGHWQGGGHGGHGGGHH